MPRKAAATNVIIGSAIASSSRNPVDRLNVKKRTYVAARVSGDIQAVAAKKAGVSRRMGVKYEKEADVQAAYRALMRKAIPMQNLVKLIKGGANATMPDYTANGKRKKKERPDWRTRKPYVDMAAEQTGFFEKKVDQNNTLISVKVEHVGQRDAERTKPIITIAAQTV